MQLDRTWTIAKREYLTRIKAKGFWIGTLVIPAFLTGVMVVPSLLLQRSETRTGPLDGLPHDDLYAIRDALAAR